MVAADVRACCPNHLERGHSCPPDAPGFIEYRETSNLLGKLLRQRADKNVRAPFWCLVGSNWHLGNTPVRRRKPLSEFWSKSASQCGRLRYSRSLATVRHAAIHEGIATASDS